MSFYCSIIIARQHAVGRRARYCYFSGCPSVCSMFTHLKRFQTSSICSLVNSECRDMKRTTHKLPQRRQIHVVKSSIYMYSDNSYQTKYETFCTTVDACKPTSRDLWITVNELFQPKVQSSRKLSVDIKTAQLPAKLSGQTAIHTL